MNWVGGGGGGGGSVFYRVGHIIEKWPAGQVSMGQISIWQGTQICDTVWHYNKSNLRDLIAATGLVILLKFDPNHRFFSPCDLEIWWMTLGNNRAPLLYYTKLCASFQIHRWIQIGVTVAVRKRSIWVKMGNSLSRVTLKFDGWPCKTIGHLFHAT